VVDERRVEKARAVEMDEGSGATVKRAFPTSRSKSIDPFVLLDEFFVPPEAGFPEHPHGGFEIVTYMLDGALKHRDSTGVERTVSRGEAQYIRIGEGIRHSEMPSGGEESHGLQLWVNLPRKLKDADPSYRSADPEELPVEEFDGATATTVVGDESPLNFATPVKYRVVEIEPGGSWSIPPR